MCSPFKLVPGYFFQGKHVLNKHNSIEKRIHLLPLHLPIGKALTNGSTAASLGFIHHLYIAAFACFSPSSLLLECYFLYFAVIDKIK